MVPSMFSIEGALSHLLKCESGSSRFQPGEGHSRGLLRAYEPSDGTFSSTTAHTSPPTCAHRTFAGNIIQQEAQQSSSHSSETPVLQGATRWFFQTTFKVFEAPCKMLQIFWVLLYTFKHQLILSCGTF